MSCSLHVFSQSVPWTATLKRIFAGGNNSYRTVLIGQDIQARAHRSKVGQPVTTPLEVKSYGTMASVLLYWCHHIVLIHIHTDILCDCSSRGILHVHRGQQCNSWRFSPTVKPTVQLRWPSLPALLVPHVWFSHIHGPQHLPDERQSSHQNLVNDEWSRTWVASSRCWYQLLWSFPSKPDTDTTLTMQAK